MTDPKQQLFFQMEIQQKLHQIIGISPLQGHLPFRQDANQSWQPFDEEIQYFLIEQNQHNGQQQKYLERASQCIGIEMKKIQAMNEDVQWQGLYIHLQIESKEAIIQISPFKLNKDKLYRQQNWKKSLTKEKEFLVEQLMNISTSIQFTNQAISSILVRQQKISFLYQINQLSFEVQLSSELLPHICTGQILQIIQIHLFKSLLQHQKIAAIEKIVLAQMKYSNMYAFYQDLPSKQKAKLVHRCKYFLNVIFYQNRLVKYKLPLYISSICKVVQNAILDNSSNSPLAPILHNIVEEEDQNIIIDLFSQLHDHLV